MYLNVHTQGSKQNILNVFLAQPTYILTLGLNWYANAQEIIWNLGRDYGQPADVICAVIAVLSPGISWEKNIVAAELVLHYVCHSAPDHQLRTLPCYGHNLRKAIQIVRSGDPRLVKGRKCQAFADNLKYPDGSYQVTVDRHTVRAWLPVGAPRCAYNLPKKVYESCAYDYTLAATDLGLRPPQVQAVCWLAMKEKNKHEKSR
jgi:hypothetical protein